MYVSSAKGVFRSDERASWTRPARPGGKLAILTDYGADQTVFAGTERRAGRDP